MFALVVENLQSTWWFGADNIDFYQKAVAS